LNVTITEAAWEDMLNIGRAIMQDSPVRAGTFIDELHDRCESLGQWPRAFPMLPGYEDKGIRRRVHGNYLIFYASQTLALKCFISCMARKIMSGFCLARGKRVTASRIHVASLIAVGQFSAEHFRLERRVWSSLMGWR
jgi:toxin ParE1/3/4